MTVDSTCTIPKIIHFVWLGNGEKDATVQKCIQSWSKFCPDYQIIEWNDEKIKDIKNIFLTEAISARYWAFASDYIRLYALLNYGGIYLDTDLELTSNIDDFLNNQFFCSFEIENFPSTALIGSTPGNSLIKKLISHYEDRHFLIEGKPDLTPNPKIFRKILSQTYPGLIGANENTTLYLAEKHVIYPSNFFSKAVPGLINYAIHHFNGSWLTRKRDKTYIKCIYRFGPIKIIKTFSGSKAEYPPKNLSLSNRVIFSFEYKERRRIYLLYH